MTLDKGWVCWTIVIVPVPVPSVNFAASGVAPDSVVQVSWRKGSCIVQLLPADPWLQDIVPLARERRKADWFAIWC